MLFLNLVSSIIIKYNVMDLSRMVLSGCHLKSLDIFMENFVPCYISNRLTLYDLTSLLFKSSY